MTTICKSMKSLMSIPTLLTVIVVAGVIALIPLSPLPVLASSDSDESETNAEQRVREKNLGSGESNDFNCDENMITSASGVDCIPSGPAPPTPPSIQPFTIDGSLVGTITCRSGGVSAFITNVAGDADGTVTGFFEISVVNQGTFQLAVNGGTTDGNTFSLSGESGLCSGEPFTVSGNCGTGVTVSYEEDGASGTFNDVGGVTCTLL
jgi:hypothetical protein